LQDLISIEKSWVWWYVCQPNNRRKPKTGELQSRQAWAKSEALSQNSPQPKAKRAGRVTQVVEHLLSKCKAQSENPSAAKRGKKKKKKE
jgi:hypothetical protein